MDLLQMSISSSFLILFLIIIRFFMLNRLPKRTFVILWGIVMFRCLVPFSLPIPSPLTLAKDWFSQWSVNLNTATSSISVSSALTTSLHATAHSGRGAFQANVPLILFTFWIAGLSVFSLYFFLSFWKSNRQLQTALPLNNHAFIEQWLQENKLRRPLRVLVSDQIQSPLAYGLFRPKILLPKKMDFSDEKTLSYILTHELVHSKRLDSLWKIASLLTVCVHWFNPLVWGLHFLLNRDLELSCDEKVVQIGGGDKAIQKAYALSLLQMAEQTSSFVPFYNNFSRNTTKERIVSIMKFKKVSVAGIALAVTLIAGTTTAFAATPSADHSTTPTAVAMKAVDFNDRTAAFHIMNQDGQPSTLQTENVVSYSNAVKSEISFSAKDLGDPYTAEEYKKLIEDSKIDMAEKVKAGTLNQEDADKMLADLQASLEAIEKGNVKIYKMFSETGDKNDNFTITITQKDAVVNGK